MTETKYRAVLGVTGVALFMIVLDNLIVMSSLPAIQHGLGASLEELEWVIDAYILSFAVLMLTGAALGERFGRRRMLVAGLLLFTGSSAAAALSTGSGMLIAARVLQGAGGAVLMPLTLTLLTTNVPAERRASALGVWSAIAGLGVALGPIAGGVLTSSLSWHWIFWVNVPVGIAAAIAAPRVLAESRGAREPIDLAGLALATAGLLGVVWATVRGNGAGWGSPPTLAAYARRRAAARSPSCGARPRRRIRCCRSGCSAAGRSRSPTRPASSCTSRCSGRSSSSSSSSPRCAARARSPPASTRCRGRRCRSWSPRSPAGSRAACTPPRSSPPGWP